MCVVFHCFFFLYLKYLPLFFLRPLDSIIFVFLFEKLERKKSSQESGYERKRKKKKNKEDPLVETVTIVPVGVHSGVLLNLQVIGVPLTS